MKFLSQMMSEIEPNGYTEDTNSTLSTQCLMILISRRIHLFFRVSCCIFARSGVAIQLLLKGKATKFKVPMLCLGKLH